MAFKEFPKQEQGIELLQRSLQRGRLAHAYLFSGRHLEELEALARTLAKTLNCRQPVKLSGVSVDCCNHCLACQKIEHENHADVFWVRPESKTRQIKIGQIVRRDDSPARVLLDVIYLKPTESEFKVGIIVAADRMNEAAANAFLKTLEEPPAKSVLILLTTEPHRLLDTILSRCLRLSFGGEGVAPLAPAQMEWLTAFSQIAAADQKSRIGRYQLLDTLLRRLSELKTGIEEALTSRSPLERYPDAEAEIREQWEDELTAAIEAEYRRQRADLMGLIQWWLRDVWLQTLSLTRESQGPSVPSPETKPQALASDQAAELMVFPQIAGAGAVARRISHRDARENLEIMEQLQRWLATNVQEALALEVGLLKLRL